MTTIHKKIVVDENGDPQAVIIPWDEFIRLEEELGLDLDEEAESQLSEADADMGAGDAKAFTPLDQLK